MDGYKIFISLVVVGIFVGHFNAAKGQSEPRSDRGRPNRPVAQLGGPTSVQAELEEDRIDATRSGLDRWNAWKDDLFDDHGLKFP